MVYQSRSLAGETCRQELTFNKKWVTAHFLRADIYACFIIDLICAKGNEWLSPVLFEGPQVQNHKDDTQNKFKFKVWRTQKKLKELASLGFYGY